MFRYLQHKDSSFLVLSLGILLLVSSCGIVNGNAFPAIPKTVCENITGVEIRFRNYFLQYLGMVPSGEDNKVPVVDEQGFVYKSVTKAVTGCCPDLNVSFVPLENNATQWPIECFVQIERIRKSNGSNNSTKLVFYFPEFADKGQTTVYEPPTRFLRVIRSPGHVVLMRTVDAKRGVPPTVILAPSLSLLAVLFTSALAIGIAVWFLDHWNNSEEFPSPFILGIFEGFWWAVVTMTTVGYGDKAPRCYVARLLTMCWMILSFLILSLIGANTTSMVANLQVSRIERTVGLKIGTLNSRHFAESEMNLGAEIKDFDSPVSMFGALKNGEVDRVLFPHYVHFLQTASRYEDELNDIYIAKVLDQPFELGLVLAHPFERELTPMESAFYVCLSNFMAYGSNQFIGDYSAIKRTEDITLGLLDTTETYKLIYTMLCVIGVLVTTGVIWDVWNYLKRYAKRHSSTQTVELQP